MYKTEQHFATNKEFVRYYIIILTHTWHTNFVHHLFHIGLFSYSYTNICCNRPFFSPSHAANVAFCFSMTLSNDERQSAIFYCSARQGTFTSRLFNDFWLTPFAVPPVANTSNFFCTSADDNNTAKKSSCNKL